MAFTSFVFVAFFVLVYGLYWLSRRRLPWQNAMLLAASYLFYGWWDVRFLVLIVLSTVVDFCAAYLMAHPTMPRRLRVKTTAFVLLLTPLFILPQWPALQRPELVDPEATRSFWHISAQSWWFLAGVAAVVAFCHAAYPFVTRMKEERRRKALVLASLVSNLGMLGFFKYFDFFADSAVHVLNTLGLGADPIALEILLPVGISFYTFQTLSYTIDVYRRQLEPTDNLLNFSLFVAFFPQLVAGPIERAATLLPQVESPRTLRADQIHAGLHLITWGYFKKLVIADNVAQVANEVYNHYTQYDGVTLVLGTLAFAFQIYCDFSAYSDIARGTSKLMGFELMLNFRLPYFATSPSDFWRRWHISLSTWLRDYLYIPLGGNRGGKLATMRNLMLTMLLGGLWHGAAWTFVLWGFYHGLVLVLYRAFDNPRLDDDPGKGARGWTVLLSRMALMFVLTLVGWVFFRAQSIEQAAYILTRWAGPGGPEAATMAYELAFFITPLLLVQVVQQRTRDLLIMAKLPLPLSILFHAWLFVWICVFGVRESVEFIYFQF